MRRGNRGRPEIKREPLPEKRLLDESRPCRRLCLLRRECFPYCLCAGYQGILAARRGEAGNGHRHGRRGLGIGRPLLVANLGVRFLHGLHPHQCSGPDREKDAKRTRIIIRRPTGPDRPPEGPATAGDHGHYRCPVARFVVDITPLRRHRHFRRLWAGQMVSGMGSQLTLVAVSFQAYAITRSTLIVGLIGLGQLVPLLAGALWGGTLADAWDRRRVLVLTQVAMALAVGGLVLNASQSHPEVWPLFVCTAASAAFQGVDWPARRAALPMLVGQDDITAAVALQTTIQQLALVAGPAMAGVLIATLGLSAVYGIDVGTFAVALVAAVLLPALVPTGGGTPMGLRSMAEGFRHLRREKLLSATYWINLNAMIFGMPRAVFPALGTHLFGGGAGVVGLLYAAPGAGSLVGSVFTGWCSRVRHQGRAIAACVVVWGTTIALFGIIPVLWIGLVLLALAGAADVGLRSTSARRSSCGPCRTPAGAPVGDLLRCGGRRSPAGRCRDRVGRGHRRPSVRGVVGRVGLCGRGRGPAVAGARAVAGQGGRRRHLRRGAGGRDRRGHHRARRGRAPLKVRSRPVCADARRARPRGGRR